MTQKYKRVFYDKTRNTEVFCQRRVNKYIAILIVNLKYNAIFIVNPSVARCIFF